MLDIETPKPSPVTVDLDAITQKVLAIRRGELPPDAVTTEELRAAIAQQREVFAAGAQAKAAKATAKAAKAKAVNGPIDFSSFELKF